MRPQIAFAMQDTRGRTEDRVLIVQPTLIKSNHTTCAHPVLTTQFPLLQILTETTVCAKQDTREFLDGAHNVLRARTRPCQGALPMTVACQESSLLQQGRAAQVRVKTASQASSLYTGLLPTTTTGQAHTVLLRGSVLVWDGPRRVWLVPGWDTCVCE